MKIQHLCVWGASGALARKGLAVVSMSASMLMVAVSVCAAGAPIPAAAQAAPALSTTVAWTQVDPSALGLASTHAVPDGAALPQAAVRYALSGTTRRISGMVVRKSGAGASLPADLQLELLSPRQGARLESTGAGWDLVLSPQATQPGARLTVRMAARSPARGQQAVLHAQVEVLARQEARLQVPAQGGRFPLADRFIEFDAWPTAGGRAARALTVPLTVHYALLPGSHAMISRVLPTGRLDASPGAAAEVGRYRIVPNPAVAAVAGVAAAAQPEATSLINELNTTAPYARNPARLGPTWGAYTAPYIDAGQRRLPNADVDSVDSPSGQLTALVSTGWPASQWAAVTPVLFIHGFQDHTNVAPPYFSGGQTYWGNLPNLVRQYTGNASRRFAPFEYRWNTDTQFVVQGAELAAAINTIHAQTGRKVVIVAHDFGGLLTRAVLQNLSGADATLARGHVESVVTLGTPHAGLADTATTLHGVALPAGQQPAVGSPFAICTQVSCQVAGKPVPELSAGDLLRLGLTAEPGVDVAALATTTAQLPAIRLAQGVGVDQDVPSGSSNTVYRRGDGLITTEGQRLFPSEVANPLRAWSAVAGSSALVKEVVLGHVDGPYTIRAQAVVDPSRWVAADPFASSGYFHGALNGWADIDAGAGRESQVPAKAATRCNSPSTCQHASWRLLRELLGSTGKLNDTGQTVCVDPTSTSLTPIDCAGSAQDGETGRDVSANDPSDGPAGFSYVKISATGTELPASATDWACVKDKLTGLIWEVKTDDGGLRDKDNFYTNFGNGRPDDSSVFINAVNTVGLCGASDWRLPTLNELQGLVDYTRVVPGPAINTDWFPNTIGMRHWTSTPYAGVSTYTWRVYYGHGGLSFGSRDVPLAVRLVRVGP